MIQAAIEFTSCTSLAANQYSGMETESRNELRVVSRSPSSPGGQMDGKRCWELRGIRQPRLLASTSLAFMGKNYASYIHTRTHIPASATTQIMLHQQFYRYVHVTRPAGWAQRRCGLTIDGIEAGLRNIDRRHSCMADNVVFACHLGGPHRTILSAMHI
jgi:hypothetical protein